MGDPFYGKSVIIIAGTRLQAEHVIAEMELRQALGWRVKVVTAPHHLNGVHWTDPYVIWWGSWYSLPADELEQIITMVMRICKNRGQFAPPIPVPSFEQVWEADADLAALEEELRSEPDLTDP